MRSMILVLIALVFSSCRETKNDREGFVPQELWSQVQVSGISLWRNEGDIVLHDVAHTNKEIMFSANLIGGTVPPANEWPASFASQQSGSGCTATLLAKNVLQLAAHCVGNGRTAVIQANGSSFTGTCTHAPTYRNDSTADWALCKMSADVARDWYEKVMQDATPLAVGGKVTLAGAGCTQPGGGGGFGTFRVGEATIQSLPRNDNDTVTKGGAALCFGDSGGSAFYVNGADRMVMGVNSRGDIQTTSYLSSVFTATAKSFYSQWATANGVHICGIHPQAEKCQNSAPGPGPSPLPAFCLASHTKLNACLFANPRESLSDVQGCRNAYATLFACVELAEQP